MHWFLGENANEGEFSEARDILERLEKDYD